MKYARIYSDAAGETHLEDVKISFSAVDFAPPAPPVNLSAFEPAEQTGFLAVPPKWDGATHAAPMKALYVFVAGEWEITASDGLTRRFGPGDIVRAEDVNSKGHATRLLSDRKGSAVVIQLQQ